MLQKMLVIIVIIQFFGITLVPIVNSSIEMENILPKNKKFIRLIITEYKQDGTKESKIVKMPRSQAEEMHEKLKIVSNLDERLAIYKEYGLISQDVTCEKMRTGMEFKAKNMVFSNEKLKMIKSINKNNIPYYLDSNPVVMNLMCLVEGDVAIGVRFYFGISWFTSLINGVLNHYFNFPLFPSVDLLNTGIVMGGKLNTKQGLLPDIGEEFFTFMFYLIAGFVGFVISIAPILPLQRIIFGWEDFFGFAMIAFAFGIPYVNPHP